MKKQLSIILSTILLFPSLPATPGDESESVHAFLERHNILTKYNWAMFFKEHHPFTGQLQQRDLKTTPLHELSWADLKTIKDVIDKQDPFIKPTTAPLDHLLKQKDPYRQLAKRKQRAFDYMMGIFVVSVVGSYLVYRGCKYLYGKWKNRRVTSAADRDTSPAVQQPL